MIFGLNLTWPDYVIIAIIGLSTIISLVRGFVREIFSLIIWVAAILLGFEFAPSFSEPFGAFVNSDSIKLIIAFFAIVIVVVIIGAIINYLFGFLVRKSGLSGTDRLIGIIFGGIRGVMVVGALVLIGNLSAVSQTASWRDAQLVPHFDGLANWIGSFIPENFKQLEMSSFLPEKSKKPKDNKTKSIDSPQPINIKIKKITG